MIFTTSISLNRFNFTGKLTFNKHLKTLEYRKHIGFCNKRIIPYIFCMRIDRRKTSEKNIGARPQTSLNIKLSGAVVYDP